MINRNPDIAFTHNPIRFKDNRTGNGRPSAFYMKAAGKLIYIGRYTVPASIDISDIADSFSDPIPDPEDDHLLRSDIDIRLEGEPEFALRLIEVKNEEDEALVNPFFAIPGGVSAQNFRRLKELNEDIFSVRLLDKRHNFFLTTRTHGWLIILDELEVFPLCFINIKDETAKISINAADTDMNVPDIDICKGIHAIDFNGVRRKIWDDYGFISSAFDVVYDGVFACRVVIRHTYPDKEAMVVKFRNSMGAFELIHLSGSSKNSVAFDEEDSEFKMMDPVSGYFEVRRPRIPILNTAKIDTGFKTMEEIRFILDMVASEEVYLLTKTGWARSIPSVQDMEFGSVQTEPESFTVSFEFCEAPGNQTPDINDLRDFDVPRIFTDQYTNQFN